MPKGQATRQRILDAAQAAILERGFTAMSLEALIADCGLTKGGFFYHFRDKTDLAVALIERYRDEDTTFSGILARARTLVDDPLQQLLLALRLAAEVMADITTTHPGWAVVVAIYTECQHERAIWQINHDAALGWRRALREMIDAVLATHTPRVPVDPDDLADMISTVVEGGIILARALGDRGVQARQMLALRALLKALFAPLPAGGGVGRPGPDRTDALDPVGGPAAAAPTVGRPSRGEATRQRILDAAQAAILQKGFTATSIDELIAECGLTKGGFFYHFKDKTDLAKALLRRYLDRDEAVHDAIFDRARSMPDDPLQVFLAGLNLLAEVKGGMPGGHPGSVVAVACYYERMFDQELRDINAEGALRWRRRFRTLIDAIETRYRPREPVDPDELADMVSTVLEGGIVMARALRDPLVLKRQILAFRAMVQALYVPRDP